MTMAKRQITQWPRQSARSRDVWSSSSDSALRVILQSSHDLGWHRVPSSTVDRFMPFFAVAMLVLSGLTIGWFLFVP
jgi:hypothetical protein